MSLTYWCIYLSPKWQHLLPWYLKCLGEQTHAKEQIHLGIYLEGEPEEPTEVPRFLLDWMEENGKAYQQCEIVELPKDLPWDSIEREATIRNWSLQKFLETSATHYFLVGLDCFLNPSTLTKLLSTRRDLIAPLLTSIPDGFQNIFFAEVNEGGFWKASEAYTSILHQKVKGEIAVAAVYGTYLISRSVVTKGLSYGNGSPFPFIALANDCRAHGVQAYLLNEEKFGWVLSQIGSNLNQDQEFELVRKSLEGETEKKEIKGVVVEAVTSVSEPLEFADLPKYKTSSQLEKRLKQACTMKDHPGIKWCLDALLFRGTLTPSLKELRWEHDHPLSGVRITPLKIPCDKNRIPSNGALVKLRSSEGLRYALIVNHQNTILVNGQYTILDATGRSVNSPRYVELNEKYEVMRVVPVLDLLPTFQNFLVQDFRLYYVGDSLYTTVCVTDPNALSPRPYYGQVSSEGKILSLIPLPGLKGRGIPRQMKRADGTPYTFEPMDLWEKNWCPLGEIPESFKHLGITQQWIYSTTPLVIVGLGPAGLEVLYKAKTGIKIPLRGNTVALPWKQGLLYIVHEVDNFKGRRTYWHRFVYLVKSPEGKYTVYLSEPFFLIKNNLEFLMGLDLIQENLARVSFSVDDCLIYVAEIPLGRLHFTERWSGN